MVRCAPRHTRRAVFDKDRFDMPLLEDAPTDAMLAKARDGGRLAPGEALAIYRSADFLKAVAAGRAARERRLGSATATYTV